MSIVNNKYGSYKLLSVLYSASNVFLTIIFMCFISISISTDSNGWTKKQIQTILPHFLKQEITRLNNKCRNLNILRLKIWFKDKKLPPCKKKTVTLSLMPSCYSPIFFSLLLICKHILCFFSMGRVFKKTQLTREYWQERLPNEQWYRIRAWSN